MFHRHEEFTVFQVRVADDFAHGADGTPGEVSFLPALVSLNQRHIGEEILQHIGEVLSAFLDDGRVLILLVQ